MARELAGRGTARLLPALAMPLAGDAALRSPLNIRVGTQEVPRLNLSLNTVKRYARATEPERLPRVPQYRPTLVDPYRDHLRQGQAAESGVGPLQLFREIKELGYPGSMNLLVRYITQGRVEGDRPIISPRRLDRLILNRPRLWRKVAATGTIFGTGRGRSR